LEAPAQQHHLDEHDDQHNSDDNSQHQHEVQQDDTEQHQLDEQHNFNNTEKQPCFDCGAPALPVRVRKPMSCSECEMVSQSFFFCEESCRAMLCKQCTCAAVVEKDP